MLGILGYFLQVAAGHILYLALHLESGSFPRPLPPERERVAFADLRRGGPAAAAARDTLIRHNLRLVAHICKKYYAGGCRAGRLHFDRHHRPHQGCGYLRPRQGQKVRQLCKQVY